MKKKTYKIIDDESILVGEEILDERENVLYAIDYSTKPVFEKKVSYDEKGELIEMIELEGGVEITKATHSYTDGGNSKESLLFISGELYEKTIRKSSSIGIDMTTYRDGEEVYRMVIEEGGKGTIIKNYSYGEFVGKQESEPLGNRNSSKTAIYNNQNQLVGVEIDTINRYQILVKKEIFGTTDNLLRESIFEVDGTSIISEIHRDLVEHGNGYQVNYEYDERGNCTRSETKDLTGNLLSFFIKSFDLQNRIIEEVSLNRGSGDAISGGFQSSLKTHFKYEYEP